MLGALIRLFTLADSSLWYDEATVYWISQESTIWNIVTKNAAENSAPPLFVLIISWISQVGSSEWILRLPAAVASIVSIPLLYILIRQFLLPRTIAYITTLLFALTPTQIVYAQEVREYSLAVLCTIIILILFIRYYFQPQFMHWLSLSISMSIGVGLQYGIALLIGGLNIIMLVGFIRKQLSSKAIIGWLLAQTIVCIAGYVVFHTTLTYQLQQGGFASESYLSHAYWDGSLQSFYHLSIRESYALLQFAYPLGIMVIVILYAAIFNGLRSYYGQLALLTTFVPILVVFTAALGGLYPYHGNRQLIVFTVMLFVLIGLAFDLVYRHISSLRISFLFFCLVIGSIMTIMYYSLQYLEESKGEHVRPLIQTYLDQRKLGENTYVYYGADPAFRYYTRDEEIKNVTYGSKNRDNPPVYIQEIETVLQKGERTWLIMSHCYPDECKFIPANLTKDYTVRIVDQEEDAFLYTIE